MENAPTATRRIAILLTPATLILFGTAALTYGAGLGALPPSPDELIIALIAHSISATGRDLNGRLLPLYFEVGELSWYTPLTVYFQALILKLAPFSIEAVRLPSVIIGIVNAGLLAAVVRAITAQSWLGLAGLLIIVTAPAHFIHSRLALDYIYPLPFILGWLYCWMRWNTSGVPRWLPLGGLFLGLGTYSYVSMTFIAPALLVLNAFDLLRTRSTFRQALALVIGFAIPLLLLAAWVPAHPEMWSDSVRRYGVYNASHLTAIQGVREFLSYPNIAAKLSLYWNNFNPTFVFLDAAAVPLFTLRGWGLFLPAVAPLVALGLVHVRSFKPPVQFAVIGGLLVTAGPAVLANEFDSTQRILPMLPFIAILASLGVERFWQVRLDAAATSLMTIASIVTIAVGATYATVIMFSEGRLAGSALPVLGGGTILLVSSRRPQWPFGRVLVLLLLTVMVVQASRFYSDFRDGYVSAASDTARADLTRGLRIMVDASDRDRTPAFYLDEYVDLMREYWQFIALESGREDLVPKARYYNPATVDVDSIPAGSIILAQGSDGSFARAAEAGRLSKIAAAGRTGVPAFTVYRR